MMGWVDAYSQGPTNWWVVAAQIAFLAVWTALWVALIVGWGKRRK